MPANESPADCDLFRPLADVLLPDPRFAVFSVVSGPSFSEWRPITIQDHHAAVAELSVGPDVPGDVRIALDTARNALLYAWFVYRFHQVAELQALASVELALRRRLRISDAASPPTLGVLLNRALAKGLIRGDHFRQYHRIVVGDPEMQRLSASLRPAGEPPVPPPTPSDYARTVVKFLKQQRNRLAQGSDMLYPNSAFLTTAAACDLIGQLFASPDEPTV